MYSWIIIIYMVGVSFCFTPIELCQKKSECLDFPFGFFFILKVKELYAKADKLKLSHPSDAPQIQQMKEDLVSNWEHIRALATRRYAKLQASFWWRIPSLYYSIYLQDPGIILKAEIKAWTW